MKNLGWSNDYDDRITPWNTVIEIEDFDIFCDEVNIISLFCKLNYTGIEINTKDKEIEIQDKILEKIEMVLLQMIIIQIV